MNIKAEMTQKVLFKKGGEGRVKREREDKRNTDYC
jgi:hypothetical protein